MSSLTIKKVFGWFAKKYAWQDTIPVSTTFGHPKLLVITGENASGKSLLRRLISSLAHKDKIEPIAISPEFRQRGGMMTVFVYGDESYDASGKIACVTVLGAIKTSKEREKPHIIILDEPDMGLSDDAAAGIAEEIVDYCNDPSPHLGLFAVITHRKAIMEPFIRAGASHVRVGDSLSLVEAYERPVVAVRPQAVHDKGLEMFRKVQKLLKEGKK